MKPFILIALSAIAFVQCNNTTTTSTNESVEKQDSVETPKAENDFLLSCNGAGKFTLSTPVEEIEKIVGTQNMVYDSVFAEGDFATMKLVIYKGTPNELVFFSQEETPPFKNISSIHIEREDSPYTFENGIKIGTKIETLQKLNGAVPVSFTGFDWDYGGGFLSFNEGKLNKELDCFSCRFAYKTAPLGEDYMIMVGDREVKSDLPSVIQANVYISEISIANRR